MAKKRDYLEEIFEKRARSRPLPRWDYTSLKYLAKALPELHTFEGNWLNFVPVRIMTTIEVVFRDVVKDLVDHGEPYSTNIFKVIEIGKFDANLLKALHGQKITIGEFTSHLISINRIDEIIGLMDRLMGIKFKDELSKTTDRWEVQVKRKRAVPIIEDINANIKTLEQLIADRHTIVHEITDLSISPTIALDYLSAAYSFLHATNELVSETLYPNAPLTQTDMNIAAGSDLEESRLKMRSFIIQLLRDLKARGAGRDRLRSLVKAFRYSEHFVREMANFERLLVEGGTMQSQVYAMTEKRLIDHLLVDFEDRYTQIYREL
ncbi:hypothetical protein ACWKW6_31770 [Dyadobacter jiangsuensis]